MKLLSKKEIFSILVLLIPIIFVVGVSTINTFLKDPIERYANEVMKICEDAPHIPSCYDEEIPKIMDKYSLSMKEAFNVTEVVQENDSRYLYCHVLGHNLSAKEASKDILNWTNILTDCPVGQCSNGCLHGAFQERFRDEDLSKEELDSLIPKLSTVCMDGPLRTFTELERGSCIHALGHLTMYVTKANPKESVALCDRIMSGDYYDSRHLCYDGAFMQLFQPLEPEDFALVDGIAPQTQADALSLCGTFENPAEDSCKLESWPLFINELKKSVGLSNFCDAFGGESSIEKCYYSLFYLIPVQFNFDKGEITSFCDDIKDPYRKYCFSNAGTRLIEIDKDNVEEAVSYCKLAEDRGIGERCWKEMLFHSRFAFHFGSESFNELCEAMPDKLQEQCFDPSVENIILFE